MLVNSLFFKGAIEHKAPKTIFNIQYTLSDCIIGMVVRLTSTSCLTQSYLIILSMLTLKIGSSGGQLILPKKKKKGVSVAERPPHSLV